MNDKRKRRKTNANAKKRALAAERARQQLSPEEYERWRKRRAQRRRKLIIQRRILISCMLLILFLLIWGITAGIRGIVSHFKNKSAPATTEVSEESTVPSIDTSSVVVNTFLYPNAQDTDDTSSEGDEASEDADSEDGVSSSIELTISSMGDCTLGTDENFDPDSSFNAYYNSQGANYFFQNVRSILEDDDLSIVNFESTLTEETSREEKKFAFKAPPEYVSVLSDSSVEAANIANNHSKDYGALSYTDTISNLNNANIATFGYEQVALMDVKGVKVGMAGIYELKDHELVADDVRRNIAALKENGAELIIVNFHWGEEREYSPNDTQIELGHLAIDEGADLVIGHHPHVLQGIENYNGKYIAYSLGNFCFGGNSNPEDKDTIIFQQTFTIENGKALIDDNINVIPCRISSTTERNDYCPTPLEGVNRDDLFITTDPSTTDEESTDSTYDSEDSTEDTADTEDSTYDTESSDDEM